MLHQLAAAKLRVSYDAPIVVGLKYPLLQGRQGQVKRGDKRQPPAKRAGMFQRQPGRVQAAAEEVDILRINLGQPIDQLKSFPLKPASYHRRKGQHLKERE